MSVNYRLASDDDVLNISKVFAEANDDLDRRHGFFEASTNPVPPNPVLAFLIRKTPGAFWVAEKDGEVVGFSDSFMRGTFWYFAWLFIHPTHQGRGIGRALLEKTLESWKGHTITNRATSTFAFNPASQGLYMRYGMYPREPMYFAHTASKAVAESEQGISGLVCEEVASLADMPDEVRGIDEYVLGFSLEWHHEFLFETQAKCYLVKNQDRLVGYVYIRRNGTVGPLAVTSPSFTKPALDKALHLSADQRPEEVSCWMPGSNIGAVELAIKYKMRLYPGVLMSTKPFAKWENYLFHSAALM